MSFYQPYPFFYTSKLTYSGQEFIPEFTHPPPPTPQTPSNGTYFYQDYHEPLPVAELPKLMAPKVGYNNRKESRDSGISEAPSRKISNISIVSNVSNVSSTLEDFDENETPFVTPDEELCQQIVQQVEFYFSDVNISKDKFLLKHVKRNKEGFVSLKLISSFKRIKHLTKDWRQVGYAIEQSSQKLEVNDVRSKVRRIQPLPEYDETADSRTVLALNLPMERPTIESVAEFFSSCGEVALIRILRPGNPLPAEVRHMLLKIPDLSSSISALIEFEKTESALKARRQFNAANHTGALRVVELLPTKANNKRNEERKDGSGVKLQPKVQQQKRGPILVPAPSAAAPSVPRRKVGVFGSPKCLPITEEYSMAKSGPAAFSSLQQRKNSRTNGSHLSSSPNSNDQTSIMTWMNRRVSGQLDIARSGLSLPPNVIRQPRGPEEGQGFERWAKIRMECMKKAESKQELGTQNFST